MPSFFPFIHPDVCERKPTRTTMRNAMGDHVMATRKLQDVYHEITYVYDKLSTRQYRILENFFRTVNGGVTSFYVVDWGDPRVIKSITGDRVVVNNVNGLTEDSGDGGNRIILWSNTGDYGNDSTTSGNVLTDTSKSWTASTYGNHQLMDSVGTEFNASSTSYNTANTFTVTLTGTPMPGAYDIYQYVNRTVASLDTLNRQVRLNASPVISHSAYKKFLLPVYKCIFAADTMTLEQTGEFNLETNDNYGPFWAGEIKFTQIGTGT